MASEIGALLNEVETCLPETPATRFTEHSSTSRRIGGWSACRSLRILAIASSGGIRWTSWRTFCFRLWEAEAPEKRWASMQYRIADGKFEASFLHEPLDPKVTTIDRRAGILQQRYGNKQIVYPPLPQAV